VTLDCTILFSNFKRFLQIRQKSEAVENLPDGTKQMKNNCWLIREDYFECLHSKKEWAMVARVNAEEKRQAELSAASGGSS